MKTSETIFAPKSLNVGTRKRENDRIERENQAFAKRLFAKQRDGSLSKKKMDEDFFTQERYKNQLRKVRVQKMLPKLNGRTGQLPPLDESVDKSGEKHKTHSGRNTIEKLA